MGKALIYGAGMLGKQLAHLCHHHSSIEILGFVDDVRPSGDGIVGSLESLVEHELYHPKHTQLIFGIGYSDMEVREKAYLRAQQWGYSFLTLIHPKAIVEPSATVMEGCVIQAGAVIDQGVRLEPFNYIDTGCLVTEFTTLGTNNYLAGGTVVGGSVTIGRNNFFGLHSTVVNDLTIGDRNFVSAASLISKNIENGKRVTTLLPQRIFNR